MRRLLIAVLLSLTGLLSAGVSTLARVVAGVAPYEAGTVLVDGKPAYSCSTLAVWMDGHSVETVEGLAPNGELSSLQRSFVEHDAPQCGFCTSGQLMSATALLRTNAHATAEDARAAMTGNLCRCGNYNRYVEAVVPAQRELHTDIGHVHAGRTQMYSSGPIA